jgi:outer membrane receptor protein involved in Fe transport
MFTPILPWGLNGTYSTRTSGNTSLKPEIGNTLSAGVVYQPEFIPGFEISVDYFDLRVTDAISTLSDQQILIDCYDSHGTSPECSLIKRPSPSSFPTEIDLIGINIAAIKTRGFDVESSYQRHLGAGQLAVKLYGTYVDQFQTQLSSNQPFREYAGHDATGSGNVSVVPRLKVAANVGYDIHDWGIFVQEQMIGKMNYDPALVYAEPALPAVFYTDLTLKYPYPRLVPNPRSSLQ